LDSLREFIERQNPSWLFVWGGFDGIPKSWSFRTQGVSSGLGANNFGWWIDEQHSTAVINHALELGINFIDTADVYDRGRSEEYTGQTLKGRRTEVLPLCSSGSK
jgi:hypothetical protein